jgi:hypothetical protein
MSSDLRLPREHGAWAMLFVPLVIGSLVAMQWSLALVLVALSATAVFIARDSVINWWRSRSRGKEDPGAVRAMLIYLAIGVAAGIPLLLFYRLYLFVAFGAASALLLSINALQAARREDRSMGSEILAICGLTLSAPAAYYAATTKLDAVAATLWLVCALYFTSSVFYVKFRVSVLNRRKPELRKRYWRHCVVYHVFLLFALAAFALTRSINVFALVAFIPVLGRSFWHLAKPGAKLNLRRVGVLEIIYSIVFLVFTTIGLR